VAASTWRRSNGFPTTQNTLIDNAENSVGKGGGRLTQLAPVVFLLDVDNTLLDDDRILVDWNRELVQAFGEEGKNHYWSIYEKLHAELGYADYLGALQRFRDENPSNPQFMHATLFLLDYPFASRLYANSLDIIERLCRWGKTVILSDGDVIYQSLKIERAGLLAAASRHALIYIHKERELTEIEKKYPAKHYILVDDKLPILTAVKKSLGSRLTTVFPRQGQYAHDSKALAANPPADITIDRIGDLIQYDLPTLLRAGGAESHDT
jgi:hypothetical protein